MEEKDRTLFALDVAVWMIQMDEAAGSAKAESGAEV